MDKLIVEQNRVFEWTPQRVKAASLLAEGQLTQREICAECACARSTLWEWTQQPAFAARVAAISQQIGDTLQHYAIARKVRRVEALNDRWEKLHQVIAERARSENMQGVPGGTTGLVVKTVKAVGKGEDFQLVEHYEVDASLLKALLEHERRAAEEAGGLSSIEERPQVHVNVTNVRLSLDELKRLPPEELRRRHREALRLPLPEAKLG